MCSFSLLYSIPLSGYVNIYSAKYWEAFQWFTICSYSKECACQYFCLWRLFVSACISVGTYLAVELLRHRVCIGLQGDILKARSYVAFPCFDLPWLLNAFRVISKLFISTHVGLACSGIPWPLPLYLKPCTNLPFHSWSPPKSQPTWYGAVSYWPALTRSLCLGASRIFSGGPLLILQLKRAITILSLPAKLIISGTHNLKSSSSWPPHPVDCQQETDTVMFTAGFPSAYH